jgi:hypothetical protein
MNHEDPKRSRGRPRTMDAEKVLDVAMTAYWQSDPADVSLNAICQMAVADRVGFEPTVRSPARWFSRPVP